MKIQVLGGYGGESLDCRMTCLLVNGTIALDAGSLSQALSIERQVRVRSILLSHSHMDHTNSLPFFIENVYGKSERGDRHPRLAGHGLRAAQVPVQQRHLAGLHPPAQPPGAGGALPGVRERGAAGDRRREVHAHPGRPPGPHPRLPDRAERRGGPLVERHRADDPLLGDRQPHAEPEGPLHRHQLRQLAAAGGGRLVPPDAADARQPSCASCRSGCPSSCTT